MSRNVLLAEVDTNTNTESMISPSDDPRSRAKRRRNRLTVSCLNCKRKKIKCDRMKPMCGACLRNRVPDGSCVYMPQKCDNQKGSNSGDSSGEEEQSKQVKRQQINTWGPIDETPRMEALLNEIDRLKQLLQAGEGWETQDLVMSLRSKDIPILKDIKKAHLRSMTNLADRGLRLTDRGQITFLGTSCFRTMIEADRILGSLDHKFSAHISVEQETWQQSLPSNVYHEKMNKLLTEGSMQCQNVPPEFTPYQITLLHMLEDYLVDYYTFMNLYQNTYTTLQVLLPVAPRSIMSPIISKRFRRGPNGALEINLDHPETLFAEVALAIAIIEFGLTGNPTKTELTVHSERETNLLYFFSTRLLEEAHYRTHTSLNLLMALIILYFIALRNTEKYDFVTFDNIPSFQSTTVQMAISMGLNRDFLMPVTSQVQHSADDPLRMLSEIEWHNIWNAVMYMDTMGSFCRGIPSLVGSTADHFYTLGDFGGSVRSVVGAYRAVNRLITSHKGTDRPPSLFQLEKLIAGIEDMNRTKLSSLVRLSSKLRAAHGREESSRVILTLLLKIRTTALLLFLYTHTYLSFRDSNYELTKMGRLFGNSLEEAKELQERYYRRSFRYAVLVLALLNRLLLSKAVPELAVFSTDISSTFVRSVYVLSTTIGEALEDRQYCKKPLLQIDDMDFETLDLLMDPQASEDPHLHASYTAGMMKVDAFLEFPASLLQYLNGFYFNSSRSSIAKDYPFFASYKYLFLCLNYMADNKLTIETLDCDKFLKEFENVDTSWFRK